jgi:carbon-monoxide dehydrogenase large subunit
MPILAESVVNFVGQPILGVIGNDEGEAEDLAELAQIQYEPLKPIVELEEAIKNDSPIVHDEIGTNICFKTNVFGGDCTKAFSTASKVFQVELDEHRIVPNPIEPRGILVEWAGDVLRVISSTQSAFKLRDSLSEFLGLPQQSVKVLPCVVGGAFGTKNSLYPEYLVATFAAMKLNAPVSWIETRTEHLVGTSHGRGAHASLSVATQVDGRILGIRGKIVTDLGAYNFHTNSTFAKRLGELVTGPFDIKAIDLELESIFTNKTPVGPYRGGLGKPEATFFMNRILDIAAQELGLDPADIRIKNLIRRDQMPYTSCVGLKLDLNDYPTIFEEALKKLQYRALKTEVDKCRAAGRNVGLGICCFIEPNSTGQGESALIKLLGQEKKILVATGLTPHGQQHKTMLAQLVADELQVELESVTVKSGDTEAIPKGVGTFGSRSAAIGGAAAVEATRKLKQKLLQEGARVLACGVDKVEYHNGFVTSADLSRSAVSIWELVSQGNDIEAFSNFGCEEVTSFGVHIAEVEVDSETGRVLPLAYKAMDNPGRAINPSIVHGQIYGGVLQGLGQVLYERIQYDEEGQPQVATLADCGIPSAVESVNIESQLNEFPSSLSHGARGIGEAGAIGALSCIPAAVEQALERRVLKSNLGMENLWRIQHNIRPVSPSSSQN